MPEYLAPGVFIEEVPPRLKTIEGVSTSTAGFVGYAPRGPVAGAAPPFVVAGVDTPRDPAPTLVTSFADFVRLFGEPLALPDPDHQNYLGHAVRGFFDNGGKRAYIVRVIDDNATRSQIATSRGVVLRLARRVVGAQGGTVFLDSLRGISSTSTLTFFRVGGAAIQTSTVAAFDLTTGSVTLASPAPDLDPANTFIEVSGLVPGAGGPIFWARSPGNWSANLAVTISPADRGPVPVLAVAGNQITVRSSASFYRGATIEYFNGTNTKRVYQVFDIQPGNILVLSDTPVAMSANAASARVLEIDVTIADESSATPTIETFRGLAWNRANVPGLQARHYATVINTRSKLVYVQPPAAESGGLADQPTTPNGFALRPTTTGDNGAALDDTHDAVFIGKEVPPRSGLHALAEIEDVRIVAVPGRTSAIVQTEIITHCERLRYRFGVLDPVETHFDANDLLADRGGYDTSHAALYSPWIESAAGDRRFLVPPSGHVAGIMARVDVERGVHKAPANEVVRGAIGLAANFTTGEQEILNPRGVNLIRRLEGRGIRVWGARTLSSESDRRYVNVRRYLIFLEASLDRGTQWVVFEPNTPNTWARVADSIGAFLNTQWREGALFGRRPDEAYFVRCDETTMTEDDVQNGRLICHIGVAIVRPAEFVIFRIEQLTGFAKRA